MMYLTSSFADFPFCIFPRYWISSSSALLLFFDPEGLGPVGSERAGARFWSSGLFAKNVAILGCLWSGLSFLLAIVLIYGCKGLYGIYIRREEKMMSHKMGDTE